jgi:monoamine oxidase
MVQGVRPFRVVGGVRKPSDLLTPFLRGVFLNEPGSVSPRVRGEIYKSFLLGKPGFVDGGASAFSRALAAPISDIHYNEVVHSVDGNHVKTESADYQARFVIVATDPVTANQLIPSMDVVRMNSSTTWYHVSDSHVERAGLFAVQPQGSVINSFAISERVSSYAPAGTQLFSSTTLHSTSESEVRRELSKIWKCDTSRWKLVAHYEIKKSLPVHPSGKPLFSSTWISESLFVAGDHRGYPSQQGAMESGKRAAKEIIERVLRAR